RGKREDRPANVRFGVKRTSQFHCKMSAFNPKRTLVFRPARVCRFEGIDNVADVDVAMERTDLTRPGITRSGPSVTSDLALRNKSAVSVPIPPQLSELQLVLEPARAELVRAFVREASLADGVAASVSGLIADDAAQTWRALCCAASSGGERARIVMSCTCGDVRTKILLHGHSRFSHIVASLARCIRSEAGIPYKEHGIDGWEVSLHRSLTGQAEPFLYAREEPSSSPARLAAGESLIDLPQRGDAAAIARCFLEVYGHHYVHSDVFSPRRYWERVESGEIIPVVARDE